MTPRNPHNPLYDPAAQTAHSTKRQADEISWVMICSVDTESDLQVHIGQPQAITPTQLHNHSENFIPGLPSPRSAGPYSGLSLQHV